MKKSEALFVFARIFLDTLMIFVGLLLAYFSRMVWFETFNLDPPVSFFPFNAYAIWALKITIFLMIVLGVQGRYKLDADEKIMDEFSHLLWGLSAGMALILVYFFFKKFTFFSRFIFAGAWGASITLVFFGRLLLRWVRWWFRKRGTGRRRVLLLGTGTISEKIWNYLNHSSDFEVIGVLSEKKSDKKKFMQTKILGAFDDISIILKHEWVDEILLVTDTPSEEITEKLVKVAHLENVKFRIIPDELGMDLATVEVSTLNNWPVLTLLNTPLQGWGMITKSIIDIVVSGISIVILSPVFMIIMFRIWISNTKAPIFYASKRVGINGEHFQCLKFRTMIPEAEHLKKKLLTKNQRKGGVFFKLENDPRITPLGRFLRKWSLDELPQLFNVLRGDMSIIGPRPHLPEEVEKYRSDDLRVLSIKPGLTGFSQIKGRSSLSFEEEMKFEVFYLKNWSLWLDVMVFFKSIYVVLRRENAS